MGIPQVLPDPTTFLRECVVMVRNPPGASRTGIKKVVPCSALVWFASGFRSNNQDSVLQKVLYVDNLLIMDKNHVVLCLCVGKNKFDMGKPQM